MAHILVRVHEFIQKKILKVELLDWEIYIFVMYWVLLNFTPKGLYQFIIPSIMHEGSDHLTHTSVEHIALLKKPF